MVITKASKADLPHVLKLVRAYHEYEDIKLSDRQRETTVDEFYITPEYRGKGLGKQVLEFITAEARKIEIKVLHLEVARSNKKARKLYAQAGFIAREKYVMMSLPL